MHASTRLVLAGRPRRNVAHQRVGQHTARERAGGLTCKIGASPNLVGLGARSTNSGCVRQGPWAGGVGCRFWGEPLGRRACHVAARGSWRLRRHWASPRQLVARAQAHVGGQREVAFDQVVAGVTKLGAAFDSRWGCFDHFDMDWAKGRGSAQIRDVNSKFGLRVYLGPICLNWGSELDQPLPNFARKRPKVQQSSTEVGESSANRGRARNVQHTPEEADR